MILDLKSNKKCSWIICYGQNSRWRPLGSMKCSFSGCTVGLAIDHFDFLTTHTMFSWNKTMSGLTKADFTICLARQDQGQVSGRAIESQLFFGIRCFPRAWFEQVPAGLRPHAKRHGVIQQTHPHMPAPSLARLWLQSHNTTTHQIMNHASLNLCFNWMTCFFPH